MTKKIKYVRSISNETLMRGFQQRKDVDITIEQERAEMKEFFKKASREKILVPKTE